MGCWVSRFLDAPADLTVLGMNANELAANPQARTTVVHDLNADPRLPFPAEALPAPACRASRVSPASPERFARARRSYARSRIVAFRPRRSEGGSRPPTNSTARSW